MQNSAHTLKAQNNGSKESEAGWRRVKFGDVVECVNNAEDDPQAKGIERVVGLDHLDPGSLHIERWANIEEGTTFTRLFHSGQVLFGKRRAYQRKLAVAEFDGICSGDILVFEPKNDDLIPELLPFIMQAESFWQHALATSAGSLSPRTKWQDLSRYEFALPPKDNQRRMAEILWAAEESIREWRFVVQELEAALRSIRENLVCNPSFPRKRLAECLESIIPGRSVLGVNEPASETEYGVLKVSAVGEIGFVASENKRLINSGDFRPEFVVRKNDFLITRCNTKELVGRVCIVDDEQPRLMLCDKTIRLTFRAELASQLFMLESLRSTESRNQIESIASGTGGAMKNISQDGIRGLCVPLPPYPTQKRIESVIQDNASALVCASAHIERIRSLQSSLVDKLTSKNGNV